MALIIKNTTFAVVFLIIRELSVKMSACVLSDTHYIYSSVI